MGDDEQDTIRKSLKWNVLCKSTIAKKKNYTRQDSQI